MSGFRVTPPRSRTVAGSRASVARLMVPTDANFMGNVFGGVILSEVDRVAYVTASRHAGATCVTASFDRVDFLEPVHLGQIVTFEARVTYTGRTSMEVWVEVRAEDLEGSPRRLVGNAYVTMVAVDAQGTPTPVPTLDLESDDDRHRFDQGRRRMEERRRTRAMAEARSP